jgi:NAD(P)-dependent dehydrogenase (short-subunit alcohol dehydrogenase family)
VSDHGARLEGKVAVVTGAGRGIGRAIAERLAAEHAAVVATQRAVAEGEELCERLQAAGADAAFVAADLREPAQVQRVVTVALDRFGGIDVLVNNAAVGLLKSVVDTTDSEYDTVIDTNLRSVFLCCRYALPPMLARGGGSVVNIGSVAATVGFTTDAAYCASKGAVEALTRQMALDYSPRGVRVNCIAPGFVETEQMRTYIASHEDPDAAHDAMVRLHPIGRIGRPEEIAAVAAFLASDEASFVTGASWAVDGGLLAS